MKCTLIHNVEWKGLAARVAKMQAAINAKAPWLNLDITLRKQSFENVKTKRNKKGSSVIVIDGDWYDANITDKSVEMTCLLLDKKQARKIGIKNASGCHYNDNDGFIETWVVANENSTARIRYAKKRTSVPEFEETFEHELKHGLCMKFGIPDTVHEDYWSGYPDLLWGTFKYVNNSTPMKKPFVSQWGLLPKVDAMAQALIANLTKAGIPIRITEGLRTYARQNALYAQGRTTKGAIVTTLKGGYSLHNHGVAFDIYPTKHGYGASKAIWEQIGKAGEALGLTWGGRWTDFKDMPHFELALGHSVNDFAKGKVDLTKFN